MKCQSVLLVAAWCGATHLLLAADPRIDSWFTDGSSRYARIHLNAAAQATGTTVSTWSNGSQTQAQPAYAGVQAIYASTDWIYLRTSSLGAHTMGPWPANFPNLPANQHTLYRLPRTATLSATPTLTGLGAIGYFVDGVAMFDSRDGQFWNGTAEAGGQGTGYWNRDAYVNEGATFDPAYAHQENSGTYHYHANPVALRHLLGDHVDFNPITRTYAESTGAVTRHSPLLGWVRDGWPVYGPYGYRSALDPSSGLRRMRSGYVLRNGTEGTDNLTLTGRGTIPAWAARLYQVAATQSGPAVSAQYPLGRYMEDNSYRGDLGQTLGTDFDLDESNGRWCVTPEFPQGVYAYFVSMADNGTPTYPYNIGRAYRGTPTGAAVTAITETVTTHFLGGTNRVAQLAAPTPKPTVPGQVVLTWSGIEGGTYLVEQSSNLLTWTAAGNPGVLVSGSETGTATVTSSSEFELYRLQLTGVATHDPVDGVNNNGGGGTGGGPGPALAGVSPQSGARGTTVTLTLTLGNPAPPAQVLPRSALLGTYAANQVTRNGNQVTARFVVPAQANPGAVTVSVTFPGPPGMGDVTFSAANGFTLE